jgi:hypothetical protein
MRSGSQEFRGGQLCDLSSDLSTGLRTLAHRAASGKGGGVV